jgi:hypothetical protein
MEASRNLRPNEYINYTIQVRTNYGYSIPFVSLKPKNTGSITLTYPFLWKSYSQDYQKKFRT